MKAKVGKAPTANHLRWLVMLIYCNLSLQVFRCQYLLQLCSPLFGGPICLPLHSWVVCRCKVACLSLSVEQPARSLTLRFLNLTDLHTLATPPKGLSQPSSPIGICVHMESNSQSENVIYSRYAACSCVKLHCEQTYGIRMTDNIYQGNAVHCGAYKNALGRGQGIKCKPQCWWSNVPCVYGHLWLILYTICPVSNCWTEIRGVENGMEWWVQLTRVAGAVVQGCSASYYVQGSSPQRPYEQVQCCQLSSYPVSWCDGQNLGSLETRLLLLGKCGALQAVIYLPLILSRG